MTRRLGGVGYNILITVSFDPFSPTMLVNWLAVTTFSIA
jgi:hypothetical protein